MLLIMLLMTSPKASSAQCAMCKRIAETGMESKSNANPNVGKGLNKGILYMLCFPYILGGTAGIIWYRNRKKRKKE